ncbi:MAG: hypothetical protein HY319_13390 [Armatimonadetes bacterium]|nr:hypothetical protein [Armatimonadota bacterium]
MAGLIEASPAHERALRSAESMSEILRWSLVVGLAGAALVWQPWRSRS